MKAFSVIISYSYPLSKPLSINAFFESAPSKQNVGHNNVPVEFCQTLFFFSVDICMIYRHNPAVAIMIIIIVLV